MSWQKVQIGSFLLERKVRWKPIEANAKGLKRIEKIDFSGTYHLVEKPTNTDMILVKYGDLLISGINAEKGAVTIYKDVEDALATIHYSAYEVDESKIDVEYFRWFLKSEAFKNLLRASAGGGIKTELKSKHLLPLEIYLPDLDEQKEIVKSIEQQHKTFSNVHAEIEQQQTYLQQLRQTILQEAVQGKLTTQEETDEPASELLKRIKAEKTKLVKEGKLKKEKELLPITDAEIPFELPKGWVWCRLGEISKLQNGYAFQSSKYQDNGIRLLRNINIGHGEIIWDEIVCYPENLREDFSTFELQKNDIVISLDRPIISTGLKVSKIRNEDLPCLLLQRVGRIKVENLSTDIDYLFLWFTSKLFIQEINPGRSNGVPHISSKEVEFLLFPLPPLAEQKRIVEKVETLMQHISQLEQQITTSQMQAQQLLQAVLKEAFAGTPTEYQMNETLTLAAEN